MTPFILSAGASLLLFIFVLGMRPPTMEPRGTRSTLKQLPLMLDAFLERRLRIAEPADRWLISVFVAAGVFSLLLFLISLSIFFDETGWIWKRRILSFAYSFEFGSIVFGCFFGIFFGYWLRSIYFRDPKEPTRFSDIITACIFLAMAFLGILGPGALLGAFSRLTALKIGGTELTFAEGHPKGETGSNDTSLAALVPPSSGGGNESAPPDTSGGLRFLADLPLLISRDAAYYYLRVTRQDSSSTRAADSAPMSPEQKRTIEELNEARTFAETSVAPIAKCLRRYVAHNGDDGEASDWLADVARWLRAIQEIQGRRLTLGDDNLPHQSWVAMWKLTGQLGHKRQRISGKEGEECATLYDDIRHPNLVADLDIDVDELPKKQREYRDDFIRHLDNQDTRIRPYLAIAAASGLAYSHDYTASLTLLDRWLRSKQEREARMGQELPEVFEIRVRTIMAGYLEEWIRFSPTAKTQTVLRYHRHNLEQAIALVESAITKAGFDVGFVGAQGNPDESASPVRCAAAAANNSRSLPDHEIFTQDKLTVYKMQLSLWYSLITLKRTWIDTVLDSSDYYQSYQFWANRYAKDLRALNYSCLLPLWESDPRKADIQRAASFDSHARVELADAFSPATRATTTREKRAERLTAALLEVLNGLSLLSEPNPQSATVQVSADADDENIFTKQISAGEASEYRERLTSIRDRLQRELNSDR